MTTAAGPRSGRARWLTGPARGLCIALICCGAGAPSLASAATPIQPATLLLHARSIDGFSGAKTTAAFAASPQQWTQIKEDSAAEAEAEVNVLTARGFEVGVFERFQAPKREAVYSAMVFATAHSAAAEVAADLAEDLGRFERPGLKRAPVPGIPGAFVLGQYQKGHRGATGNVLFSTGRCLFVVADAVREASSRAQGSRGPMAAAKVMYARAKALCE